MLSIGRIFIAKQAFGRRRQLDATYRYFRGLHHTVSQKRELSEGIRFKAAQVLSHFGCKFEIGDDVVDLTCGMLLDDIRVDDRSCY